MPGEVFRSGKGLLVAIAGLIMVIVPVGLPMTAAAAPVCKKSAENVTCTYTAGANRFKVPKRVSSIHVLAVGGAGASGVGLAGTGGNGARVEGDLVGLGGTTLHAVVGGNGSIAAAGSNGGGKGGIPVICVSNPAIPGCLNGTGFAGGGGGASDIRSSRDDPSSRLLVAAGGGGGGAGGTTAFGQPTGAGGGGGTGGGGDGANGADFVLECSVTIPLTGGTGGVGGAAASAFGGDGGNGFLRAAGPSCISVGGGGGGGGGGLLGGAGGGGGDGSGGGGGGGSNLVPPGGSESVDTTRTPLVQISYPRGR